jgi:Kef-type K+ transport system membrane component KefB
VVLGLAVILLAAKLGSEVAVRLRQPAVLGDLIAGVLLKVGLSSFLVAVIGVIVPAAPGFGVGALLLPGAGPYAHAFLGATLAATSVGITARVLKDIGRSQSKEARIILGAAVIDDVLGLVILAVITGVGAQKVPVAKAPAPRPALLLGPSAAAVRVQF